MPKSLPLSILDLAPIVEGTSPAEALRRIPDLAQLGEKRGFERIWYAEHHGLPNIAAAVPELMIARAAEHTTRIRVGAGGIMLPNHVPLKVVENFRTLNALYEGRIDLGIGRAGGTDGLTMRALRSTPGDAFSHELAELLAFENGDFPDGHPFADVAITPEGVSLPPIWLLGSSGASAQLAGQLGVGYAFASHFVPTPARPALEAYRAAFTPSEAFREPSAILCLQVICAPTEEEAQFIAGSSRLGWVKLRTDERQPLQSPEVAAAYAYSAQEKAILDQFERILIVGDPDQVKMEIEARAESAGATEVMIAGNAYDPAARLRSFSLIADAFGL